MAVIVHEKEKESKGLKKVIGDGITGAVSGAVEGAAKGAVKGVLRGNPNVAGEAIKGAMTGAVSGVAKNVIFGNTNNDTSRNYKSQNTSSTVSVSIPVDNVQIENWVRLGEEAKNKYDYSTALQYYEKAANAGNIKAMVEAGYIEDRHRKNYSQAMYWYTKALDTNDDSGVWNDYLALAMMHMGIAYDEGEKIEKNEQKATELIEKAANLDWVPAIDFAAYFYADKILDISFYENYDYELIEEYYQKSVYWYKKLASTVLVSTGGYKYTKEELEKEISDLTERTKKLKEKAIEYELAEDITESENKQEKIKKLIHRAKQFEKNEDYAKAIRYYEKAGEAGDRDAMSDLADVYSFKLKDESKAFVWFKKAAELGDIRCMYNTGVDYEQGRGIEKDLTKAFEWIKKSAEAGYVQAMCKLGDYYLVGMGIDKDVAKANQSYKKAIEAGTDNVLVMRNLGKHYLDGIGIEKDHKKAFEVLLKAAKGGDIISMGTIGVMYYVGDGVEQDYNQAFNWINKSAEKDDGYSLCNLGVMYYEGNGVERNIVKAIECYQKAYDKGYVKAKKALEELIDKTLNSNNIDAILELVNFKDRRKGFDVSSYYHKRVVEIGDVKLMLKIARRYNIGEGVVCDQRLALYWFMRAVNANYDEVRNLVQNDTIVGDNSEAKFNWYDLFMSAKEISEKKAIENLNKKSNVELAKVLEQVKKRIFVGITVIATFVLLLIVNNVLYSTEKREQEELKVVTQVTQDQAKPEANENNEKKDPELETSSKKEEQLEEINADKEPTQSQNSKPSVSPSLGENWIKDTSNNIYLFNPTPKEGESIKWSGGFVQDGDFRFADGAGTTTWYRNGEIIQVDEGTFEHGQRHGKFKHTFKNGSIDYSNWNHGEEIVLNNAPTNSAENEARQAFINYHRAITAENYNEAYSMLTEEQKQRVGDFRKYASGYIDTVSSEVSDISTISVFDNSVTFNYRLKARDWFSDSDKIKVQIFDGQVTLIKIDNRWYINNAKSSKVNEWYE